MLTAAHKIRGAGLLRDGQRGGSYTLARAGATLLHSAADTTRRALLHSHAPAALQQQESAEPQQQPQRAPRQPWNYGRGWQTQSRGAAPRAPPQQQQQQQRANGGEDGPPTQLADERIVQAAQGKWVSHSDAREGAK